MKYTGFSIKKPRGESKEKDKHKKPSKKVNKSPEKQKGGVLSDLNIPAWEVKLP